MFAACAQPFETMAALHMSLGSSPMSARTRMIVSDD